MSQSQRISCDNKSKVIRMLQCEKASTHVALRMKDDGHEPRSAGSL